MKRFLFLFIVTTFLFASCRYDEDFLEEKYTRSNEREGKVSSLPTGDELINGIFNHVEVDSMNILTVERYLIEMEYTFGIWYRPLLDLLHKEPINNILYYYSTEITAAAYYDPLLNNICVRRSGEEIAQMVLYEELIHAGQERVYKDGIVQYAKAPGTPNIEFEAKLTIDIINFIRGLPLYLNIGNEYVRWVERLCEDVSSGYVSFPSMQWVLTLRVDSMGYYEMANCFREIYPSYDYPVLDNLKPEFINFTYTSIH